MPFLDAPRSLSPYPIVDPSEASLLADESKIWFSLGFVFAFAPHASVAEQGLHFEPLHSTLTVPFSCVGCFCLYPLQTETDSPRWELTSPRAWRLQSRDHGTLGKSSRGQLQFPASQPKMGRIYFPLSEWRLLPPHRNVDFIPEGKSWN